MSKKPNVSWKTSNGVRLFGTFLGYTGDIYAQVKVGDTIFTVPRSQMTWQMG